MRRRLATPAALAVLMLGLTACVGDDGTGPITEAPSYPNQGSDDGGESPETSDGGGDEGDEQAAPDIPAPDPANYPGMDERTADGAEQFTRYYMDVVFWSHQSGEHLLLDSLAADQCSVCARAVSDVQSMAEQGKLWSESSVSDLEVSSQEGEEFEFLVSYQATLGAHSEPDMETWEMREESDQRYTVGAGLLWRGDGWSIGDLGAESEDA